MSERDEPSESIVQKVTPNFIRRSFALKFGIVLLVMGLSVGVVGIAATDEVRSQTEDNVEQQFRNTALQQSNTVEQWVDQNRLSTRLISNQDRWTNDDIERQFALRNVLSRLPSDARNVHLIQKKPSGTEVVASTGYDKGASAESVSLGWTNNANIVNSTDVTVSSVYTDGEEEDPTVGFASPVSRDENLIIVVEYSIGEIASDLQGAEHHSSQFSQVVSTDGTIIVDQAYASDEHGRDDMTTQTYPVMSTIENGNALRDQGGETLVRTSMPANDELLGEEYAVGVAPVEGTSWVVVTHEPTSSVFGFVERVEQYGLFATVGLMLLIGGVGAILGWNTASSIDTLTQKTEEMREGNLDVELRTSRIDNIGRLYAGFADMRDSLRQQIDEAERARKEAEVSRAEAMEMSNYLQEKAEEFSVAMEQTAAGDMTTRMEQDGENEAMDRIAAEFNQMIEELEKTTGQLKSFSEEVAESGDVVLQSAESVRDASEQVAESVQKISDDAYAQKDQLQRISEDLDELVETLEGFEQEYDVDLGDSLDQFRDVATQLQETADTSEEMMAESETVAGAAEEQAAELNEVSSRAEQLKRYARPLGDILERFETEAEHEFVFSGGPSQTTRTQEEDD